MAHLISSPLAQAALVHLSFGLLQMGRFTISCQETVFPGPAAAHLQPFLQGPDTVSLPGFGGEGVELCPGDAHAHVCHPPRLPFSFLDTWSTAACF